MPNWLRGARQALALLPGKVPDAPALPVRDPWPGEPARGARLLKGELERDGVVKLLKPGEGWTDQTGSELMRAHALGFSWLRDLRALGTDSARMRARMLVGDFLGLGTTDRLARRADVLGARLTAWLSHYDFFAASADDGFRRKLMSRLVADARALAAALPAEALDARALTALKGLIAAAVALPEHTSFLNRAQKFLTPELARQVLPDGSHIERSPAAHMAALQDLVEIRALLQAAQVTPPPALSPAIERMALALRTLRHGDGGLALFNGSKEDVASLIELAIAQASRGGRAPGHLPDGGFFRLQAGRSVVILDCGLPPPSGMDRLAHAGTLAFELSVGRERLIVNCGGAPGADAEWRDAARLTAAHSTLVIADTSSAELRPSGLGRRATEVTVKHQDSGGAHWLELSHDGWRKPFGAIHRRRLYLAESGEDIRGEDVVEADTPQPFVIRFHLHPNVQASLSQDGEAVLLRLPAGGFWRLRADGGEISLEESVYLGAAEPRRCEQVVLTSGLDGPQQIKWAITKAGAG